MASQRELFNTWAEKLKYLPFLIALGVGLSVSNGLAAIEGLLCEAGEFVRTPKFGVAGHQDKQWQKKTGKHRPQHGTCKLSSAGSLETHASSLRRWGSVTLAARRR